MANLPEFNAPSAPQLDLEQLAAVKTGQAPPTPEPKSTSRKKPSGGSRRGDMSSADYKAKKSELVKELNDLRSRLGVTSSAAPDAGTPLSGPIQNGVDPVTMREKTAEQLGALVSCIAMIVFEMLARWRGPSWEISETRADQLGTLWGEYLVHVTPESLTPKDLALLTAGGATAGLVVSKLKQERDAKAAKTPPAPTLDREPPRAQPAAAARPLFGPSRS